MSNIRPLYDRIIVKRDQSLAETAGGIALPEQYRQIPKRGTVVAVGPGYQSKDGGLVPLILKVGDRVIFVDYAGTEIEENGEKLSIMRESDITATVVGDDSVVNAGSDAPAQDPGDVHPFYQRS